MNEEFVTKDSGKREEFSTGSKRDTRENKGRYDLLPPRAIKRLAQLYERGAVKYGDRNWEKGQPVTRYIDSMIRHAFQALQGKADEDHLIAVAWNALAAVETLERIEQGLLPVELNDLPVEKPLTAEEREIIMGTFHPRVNTII